MENMSGISNMQNYACNGKQPFLPPRSPVPGTCMEPFGVPIVTARHELRHHHRTSSESMIVEEQPSWVDDLLNEPEMPTRRGAHRRSSSDSLAYLDVSNIYSSVHIPASLEYHRSLMPLPSWGAQEFDRRNDVNYASYYHGRPQNRGWEISSSASGYPSNVSSRSKNSHKNMGSLGTTSEPDPDRAASTGTTMQNQDVPAHQNVKGPPERSEGPHTKHSQPDVEQKRIKQQFAQRSRVRKIQYIAELERNVKALQAEGSEALAELQFIDQQNVILSLENETLRQRLDSLSQEHLVKQFEQEMLEREIARLRSFLLQQKQQQPPAYTHGRSNNRDLDSQFANLSLKHKEANSARDTVPAPLRI